MGDNRGCEWVITGVASSNVVGRYRIASCQRITFSCRFVKLVLQSLIVQL